MFGINAFQMFKLMAHNYRELGFTELAQTFQDFEICIADNCSTDNSWEIIQQYVARYKNIKAIRNSFNMGFAGNLDRVSQLAEGEWHIMLSSDDLMMPTALEEYNNVINAQKNNPLILINSSVIQFDNEKHENTIFIGNRRKVWAKNFTSDTGDIISESTNQLLRNGILNFVSPYNFVSLCYHKLAYINSGGYEASRIQNPDKWFHWKISLHTEECIYINKVLFKYRWHNTNQLSIQKKTGVLRYWLDEYRNCYELGTQHMQKTNLNKNQIEHAFLNNCINNYIGASLLKLNLYEVIRLWAFGIFTYPSKFITKPSFWIVSGLLLLPLTILTSLLF